MMLDMLGMGMLFLNFGPTIVIYSGIFGINFFGILQVNIHHSDVYKTDAFGSLIFKQINESISNLNSWPCHFATVRQVYKYLR